MPRIIDYPHVLRQMQSRGFVSLYHNAGAFGFASSEGVKTYGFVAAPDPTIRAEAHQFVRQTNDLSNVLRQIACAFASDAWLMPKSHWHYELHFGNRELLESLLPSMGIDPALLRERNDGSAIAFAVHEAQLLGDAAGRLLGELRGSDFLIAWPDAATLCTIHHHKQLWLQTTRSIDPVIDILDR